MDILQRIARHARSGEVVDVCIGLNWTAVVVDCGDGPRCGLAATLNGRLWYNDQPEIPHAGALAGLPISALLEGLEEENSPLKSLALAALNAALPPLSAPADERNAVEVIAKKGKGRHVALIGHFPFVDALRPRVGRLSVLEMHPRQGDLPASTAPAILPRADLVAITAMTLMNGTFEDLMAYCPSHADILLLGPSTPLSPLLFDAGVTHLAGAQVKNIPAVLRAVAQGGNFRQVRRAGVDLLIYRRG